MVTRTEARTVLPPAAMTEAVVEPRYQGGTNEDVLNYTLELRGSVRECNAQLDSLRQWREDNGQ